MNINNTDGPGDQVYLTAKQVRVRYGGCSHMWIERRLKDDSGFPRPIFIGRRRFWRLDELTVWEAALPSGLVQEAA
jgi:predicted DNA-binding transcriptional regulator AlpA